MTKVAIIGAGELGWALGRVLQKGDFEVVFWDRSEEQLMSHCLPSLALPEVVKGAEFVFLCVPSWGIKEALAFLNPYWPKNVIAVLFSKGLDQASKKLPLEIAKKLLPTSVEPVVVSGAMIAEEISQGHFGACFVSSEISATSEKVAKLFAGTNILASTATDLKGVAWSGVLKNIYGLGLGIAEGLGWTINERGLLFGESTAEILRLLKILGGKKETFLQAPMIADFVATSFDKHSLNHQAGLDIGHNGQTDKKSEGLMSLAPLLHRLKKNKDNFPILLNLAKIIIDGEDPQKVFGRY